MTPAHVVSVVLPAALDEVIRAREELDQRPLNTGDRRRFVVELVVRELRVRGAGVLATALEDLNG